MGLVSICSPGRRPGIRTTMPGAQWLHAGRAALLALGLSLGASTAHARGDGDLWIMVIGPMCLSRFPEFSNTDMAKFFLRGADIGDFVDRPFGRCFRQHNWASRPRCEEVMGLQKARMRDLQPVYEHHRTEIRGLKPAFDYFNAYVNQDPTSASWPFPCPERTR
jgi:hypothetical protein